jgi:hypothetical protein
MIDCRDGPHPIFLNGAEVCLLIGFRLRFSCSGLHRQTGFPPRRPASGEGARFLPSCLSEFLRHTGAGRFVRSGAIGDEPRLLFETEFPRAFGHMVGRHSQRPLRLKVVFFKAAVGAHVEDRDRLFRLPQAA